jgi:hypothetical protein
MAKKQFLTTSNAALERLVGRAVKSACVIGIQGSAVTLNRHQGGCWSVDGRPRAVEALKAKLQSFTRAIAAEKKTTTQRAVVVSRPAALPVILRRETLYQRTCVVSHKAGTGTFIAVARPSGNDKQIAFTGASEAGVWADLESFMLKTADDAAADRRRKAAFAEAKEADRRRREAFAEAKADARAVRKFTGGTSKLTHSPFAGLGE